jgi:large subunit ribosomal protein L25
MPEVILNIEKREISGKKAYKYLKSQGKVPGVFYAHGEPGVPIAINYKELMKIIGSGAHVISAVYSSGEKRLSVLKEYQFHPLTDELIHIDIMGIKETEKIKIKIPLHLKGTAEGVKIGGILQHTMREVEIECLPTNIPDFIEVDVTHLQIGDSIKVKDVKVEKIKIVLDPEQSLCSVVPPTIIKEEVATAEAAAQATAEPEVIKKGKEEKESEVKEGKEAKAPAGKEAKAPAGEKKETKPEKK